MEFKTIGNTTFVWDRVEVIHKVFDNRLYVYTNGVTDDDYAMRYDDPAIIAEFFAATDDDSWVNIGKDGKVRVNLHAPKTFTKTSTGYSLGLSQQIANVSFSVTNAADIKKIEEFLKQGEPEPEPEVTPADFFHDPAGFYASYVEWAKEHPFPSK